MIRSAVSILRKVPVASATRSTTTPKNDAFNMISLVRSLHLTSNLSGASSERRDLRTYRMTMNKVKHNVAAGEMGVDIDSMTDQNDLFPDVNTPNRLFDGILYKELPVFNIKCCPNNTIMSLTDFKGKVHIIRSCGVEGFKTARKGTNVAAQTTAVTMSGKALALGVRTAKVRVQGLGPGRLAAIKGLQMGGINIVSITDNTHVSWSPPRARKQRRV